MIVPPSLIVRLKSHFHSLPFGVDLIIGLNGYIWVSKTVAKVLKADGEEVGFGEESGEGVYSAENEVRTSPFLSSGGSDEPLLVGHLGGNPSRHHARRAPPVAPRQVLHPHLGRYHHGGVRGVGADRRAGSGGSSKSGEAGRRG